eukprot:SAG11_NODE_1566_length_4673_cov_3.640796_3_plen_353_part_00
MSSCLYLTPIVLLADVAFGCDGKFDAPTDDCRGGRCSWWADSEQVHIEWGSAGRHSLRPEQGTMERAARRGSMLHGRRVRDGDPCHARFVKSEDCPQDWYEVLGVEPTSTQREIQKAYRRLSRIHHPDMAKHQSEPKAGSGGAPATGRFELLAAAYEVLSDADKRSLFDKQMGHVQNARLYAEEQSVVKVMSASTFQRKSRRNIHIVDFYAPWCGHCMELAPEFRRAALAFDSQSPSAESGEAESKVEFHAVNCDEQKSFCNQMGVRAYPAVRLYHPSEDFEEEYNGGHTATQIEEWVRSVQKSEVVALGARNFKEQVYRSLRSGESTLWLVDFSAGSWCGPCRYLNSHLAL